MKKHQSQTDFPKPLQQWFEIVQENLPSLTRLQARVLAMWGFSLVVTKRIGLTIRDIMVIPERCGVVQVLWTGETAVHKRLSHRYLI